MYRGKLRCTICLAEFITKRIFIRHLEEQHDIHTLTETLLFDNKEEFHNWKDSTEKSTSSSFAQVRKNVRGNIKRTYYECHRSGIHQRKGESRKLKAKGSNKIGGTCPAGIRVDEVANEKLRVFFNATHVGHSNEINRARLSRNVKQTLADQLENGVSKEAILKTIKDSVSSSERLSFLTKQDLLNINKSYKKNEPNDEVTTTPLTNSQESEVHHDTLENIRKSVQLDIEMLSKFVNMCSNIEELIKIHQTLLPLIQKSDLVTTPKFQNESNLKEIESQPINVILEFAENIISVQLATSS